MGKYPTNYFNQFPSLTNGIGLRNIPINNMWAGPYGEPLLSTYGRQKYLPVPRSTPMSIAPTLPSAGSLGPLVRGGVNTASNPASSGGFLKTLGGIGKGIGGGLKAISSQLPTLGDAIGMYATYKGYKDYDRLIDEERVSDTPNINPYKNFGQRGLAELDRYAGHLAQQRDRSLMELERNNAVNNTNIGANTRSINQARAFMQAGHNDYITNKSNIDNSYSQALALQSQMRSGQLNNMDQYSMQGEYQRDLADRQDKAAYFQNKLNAIQSRINAMQSLGGNLNAIKLNNKTNNLIRQLSNYGFEFDSDGNIVKR